MNERLAAALRKVAEGLYEAADALFEGSAAAAPVLARPSAVPDAVPEFPPNDYEDLPVAATAQNEPVLGRCPDHDVAWTVKPAGTSKAGKPYTAFWRCDTRDADGYCSKKPVKAWADAHPLT